MKRAILPLLAATLALGCARRPGPVPAPPAAPAELSALDGWLAEREAAFPDVVSGAEKTIVWADPDAPAKTPVSLVYLHGFSASRQEVDPLIQSVGAELGANVFLTRLRGHGRSDDAMAEAVLEDWLTDAHEALAIGQQIGEQVVVVGTSTGGTLAAWLADDAAGQVDALVYMSPNFGPRASGSRLLLMPGRGLLVRLIVGEYREWEPHNDVQREHWTWRYPSTALFPMMELVRQVEDVDLGAIDAPSLLIYSPNDQVIRPDLCESRFEEMGGEPKRLLPVESSGDPSNHVLAGSALSPELTAPMTQEIAGFLREALALPEETTP